MNRKDFIRKGLWMSGGLISTSALGIVLSNKIGRLKPNENNKNNSEIMKNTVLHKAETRCDARHGWLHSLHTFSFSNYYDP